MKKSLLILSVIILGACETTIVPKLESPENILVIDAWINNKPERQEIRITRSQPYFDNSQPQKVSGAEVMVEDLTNGTVYHFNEGETSYAWDPADAPFGEVGNTYRLRVTVDGETFESFSKLGRVPPIDTIRFMYNDKDLLIEQEYYTGEFIATDPVGTGDTYWIKGWKNGQFLGKPAELNMAYDAGFNAGQALDGQVFLSMIRNMFLNPLDENPDKENTFLAPYVPGDSLSVEIHSVNEEAYHFLFAAYYQISRPGGFGELFSVSLANLHTNITSTDQESGTHVAGFFNVAGVSSKGQKLTEEIAAKAKQDGK